MKKLLLKVPNSEIILNTPAFLVGNGINYLPENDATKDVNVSWKELLMETFPNLELFNITNFEKDLDGLTYPEIAELAELYARQVEGKKYNNTIKNKIAKKLISIDQRRKANNLYKNHSELVRLAKTINCPILTTNYDHLLLNTMDYPFATTKQLEGKRIEEPFLIDTHGKTYKQEKGRISPINMYFRYKPFTPGTNICEEFAIWPIHGSMRFPGSICINNDDYARNTAKIEESLKNITSTDDKRPWKGKYRWPNIFINNDLVILGLGLDYSETDLRALLTRRFKYNKSKGNNIRTIYIYRRDNKTKELPAGKERFFKALEIDCIGLQDSELYRLYYLSIID